MVEEERLQKLRKLRESGVNPYPYRFKLTHHSAQIKKSFNKFKNKKVSVAGRIVGQRGHGKLIFIDLRDEKGDIQVALMINEIGRGPMEQFKLYDKGDIVGVVGTVFKTKAGEVTIKAKKIELLCKSVSELPVHWYGLKDIEARYRQRYVDLIVNPEVKKIFEIRTKVIDAMREYLNKNGYIEVETPILQPIYGGAAARPFKTFLHDLKMDVYLRISNELYLKRLLVGGFEKVYEFAKDFRNEGIDKTHNPEFTQLEFYEAYADYNDMIKHFEEIIKYAAKKALGTTKVTFRGRKIDFAKPWRKLTMTQAIKRYTKEDVTKMSDKDLKKLIKKYKLDIPKNAAPGLIINELFEKECEKHLIQPTILMDHPKETTPLCKAHRKNPFYVERFEPYVAGMELGNAYSELNDPVVQKQLFEEQVRFMKLGDEEAHPMDEDFVRALEYGMPPTGGLGIGIDRIVMIFTGLESIRDVIFFPFMRPEEKHKAKKRK